MTELIKLTEHGGKKAVSAKEVYLFLGFDKSNWSRWVHQNIINNEFAIEFEDYMGFVTMTNGNESKDFALSIEFAKKLSMMAKTEKGEIARKYFIECENKLKKQYEIPQTYSQALMLAAKQAELIELQQTKINELEPKADVFDKIADADNLLSLNEAAKTLGYGRNKMTVKLRELNILMANNNPYQKYIDQGYFETKVKVIKMGETSTDYCQTYVTGKGLTWLAKQLKTQ